MSSGKLLDAGTTDAAGQLIIQNDGDGSDRQLWQLASVSAARMANTDISTKDEFKIYPSPADTEFYIENGEGTVKVIVQLLI